MRPRFAPVRYDTVLLRGGWDQITPSLSLKPGVVRDAVNYEASTTGGYTRIAGYERFDGRPKPSDATYDVIEVTAFANVPSVGDTLTGNSSGATGQIIAVGGSYVVVTKTAGTFSTPETVKVGATTIGTTQTQTSVITAQKYAQYRAAAANVYRADIDKVPGEGPVRGVFGLQVASEDVVFAFRDNVGATSCDLYKSSTGGWVQVDYLYEVYFNSGAVAIPQEGETLTQGGVTATIRRVVVQSGSDDWTGTAQGKFIIEAPAGGNFAAGAASVTVSLATVVLEGAQTAITMLPGGRFQTDEGNFTGSSQTLRAYGCDGVNRMWEFDGEVLTPIDTALGEYTPSHVVCHLDYLFYSYRSSLGFSGPGAPYKHTAADGAGEIAVGSDINDLLVQPGAQDTGALAVFCDSKTSMLYGKDLASFNLVPFNTGTGGVAFTAQNMAQSFVLDTIGVFSLTTTLAYGNFQAATLTSNIRPFIEQELAKVAASSLNRSKNQYRLFFNDGYGLYITVVNAKNLGAMPVYYPNVVYCTWEGRQSGEQVAFFGDADGYVHQFDKGSSFDGANIDHYITFNWNAIDSPRILKQFRHAVVEMTGDSYAEINFGYQLGYGNSVYAQALPVLYSSGFQLAPSWDAFTWDSFVWDGRTILPTEVSMRGTAENVQITISGSSDYVYAFTLNSVITHYTPRRGLR